MRSILAVLLLSMPFAMQAADIALGSVSLAPGDSVAIPLSLTAPAGIGGVTVALASSDTSKVRISPDNIYIREGSTAPFSQPRLTGIAFGSATISASAHGLTGTTQIVQVSGRLSGPQGQTIQRGATVQLMFELSAPATAPLTLTVRSDNSAVAGVPASVTIPLNGTLAVVPVAGLSAGTTVVHISALPDVAESLVNINVQAPGNITLSPVSMKLGQIVPFPITLGTPAPPGGVVVTLSSSDSSTVAVSPTSVVIPAGATSPSTQPQVTADNIGAASITASAPTYLTASQQVLVTATITMSPQTLTIPVGATRILSMILSSAAPSGVPITGDRAAGGFVPGLTVQLSSSDPRVATLQPTVQFYPDGSSITTVVVVVSGVAPGTAVIHASALPAIPDATAVVIVGAAPSSPASITVAGGTPQTAQTGAPFGLPLAALVQNAAAQPVVGAIVTFTAPGFGPGLTFAGGVNTAVTDSQGIARSQTATANGSPGTYSVTASVAGVAGVATFSLTNTAGPTGGIVLPGNLSVGAGQTATLPVTLTSPAASPGVTVTLASSNPATLVVAPPTVFIGAGAIVPAVQPQVTGINFGSATVSASAPGYNSASQPVQVSGSLKFLPPALTINGLGTQTLSLLLSSPAPPTGLNVGLSSSNPGCATVPPAVTIPPSAVAVSVPVTAISTGQCGITAATAIPNVSSTTAAITVVSGSDITIGSVSLAPGDSVSLPLSLAAPARPGGVTITLSSSDTTKVTVSYANVYIPEGATVPWSQPRVTGIAFGSASISASAFGLTGASQTLRVSGRLSGPHSQTIQRGVTTQLMFALSSPVASALTLTVSSDNPAVASVPASVTIPVNGTLAVVPVTGLNPGTTVVHVSALPDVAESVVNINVQSPGNITLAPVSMKLGQIVPFPVTIGAPAPPGGVVVTLSSSDANAVAVTPSSVMIPAGAITPATQPQVTAHNIGVASITASAAGYAPATQQAVVTATITMSPQTLTIPVGGYAILSMILSSAAPSGVPITPDRGAGGFVEALTVKLSSSDSRIAAVQPTVQFYPDGSSITTVVVVVNGLAPGTAVIHANALPAIPDVTATVIVQ